MWADFDCVKVMGGVVIVRACVLHLSFPLWDPSSAGTHGVVRK